MAVNVLQLTEDDAVRGEWRAHRVLSLLSLGSLVAVLVLLGVECYHLWLAWSTGDHQNWSDFWDSNKNLWYAASFWFGWLGMRGQFEKVYAKARALRCAFAQREAQLAPPAPEQPAALPAADVPIGTERLGPFASPAYREPSGMVAAGVLCGVVGVGLAVGAVALYNTQSDDADLAMLTFVLCIVCGVVAVLGFAAFGYMLWLVRHRRRGVWLAADDWGVRRLCARRRERIEMPWHEARAFFRLDAPPDERHALRAVYGLYGSDRLLAWAVPTRAGADQLAANERLCRLIATRTSLPLRALSTESGLLANDDSAANAEPTALQPAPTTPTQRQGWNPGCVLVLLCLLVPLVGLITQFAQGR